MQVAAPLRRVTGRLHGGRWRRAGVDGILHAQRATGRRGCKVRAIADSADSFAASPGTITGVITLSVAHTRAKLPVTSLVAIAVATGITWLAMVLVARFGGKPGGGGFLRDTLTRFMGLIVLSMGVQFALTGYHAFMK